MKSITFLAQKRLSGQLPAGPTDPSAGSQAEFLTLRLDGFSSTTCLSSVGKL